VSLKKQKYILPRNYLSYSQIDLWRKSPKQYRKQYYSCEESSFKLSTPAINFGKETAEKLENRCPTLSHIKKYSNPEYKILVDIGGYPFLSYLDDFCDKEKKFLEYKTGKIPWSESKVKKHKQLDIYSLAIWKKHGEVCDTCELHHLVTTDKLRTRSTPIRLTGEVVVYERVITQEDRDKMEEEIKEIIKEINNDYKQWRKENP